MAATFAGDALHVQYAAVLGGHHMLLQRVAGLQVAVQGEQLEAQEGWVGGGSGCSAPVTGPPRLACRMQSLTVQTWRSSSTPKLRVRAALRLRCRALPRVARRSPPVQSLNQLLPW